MSKTITATAVISAKDSTGSTLDKIAAKFKGLEKNAKAMEGIKPLKFTGNLEEELKRLQLSERQLQGVRREYDRFHDALKAQRPRAEHYFRAINDWQGKTVDHWRQVRVAADEAHAAQKRYLTGGGLLRAAGGMLGAGLGVGALGYYGGRAARFALEKSKEANRETTKQRQSGLTQAQSDAIAAESERQSRTFPSLSETELRSAGREATMQLGSSEAGLKMMPTIGKFMTAGKVLWGSDNIDEQTRKALQVLDARQITDPERASSLLDALIRSSQVEGGPDFKAGDLRTALRYGRDMTRGQSDRFITSVLPQLGVDMGYSQAGTGLASMHSALIGGRQKDAATEFQKKIGLRNEGGLVGQDLFTRDVDKWFDEHFIPAMKKAGVDTTDQAAVAAFNSKFFSNRTAADVAGNMVSGQQQRIRRREQQEKATGMAGAESLHTKDVGVALEAVNKQLTNMASSAKLAEASIAGLNSAMGMIQKAGEKMNEPGGWFDSAKKQIESEQRDANAIGGAVKSVLDWDKKTGVNMGWVVPRWVRARPETPYPSGEDPMGADYSRRQFHSNEFWGGLGREGASASSAARLRREAGIRGSSPFAVPGLSPTMTYGTGVGGEDKTLSGEVHGEAALSIKIEAPELIKAYYDAQKVISMIGQISGNGVGSTGKSSPDAAAPAMPSHPSGGHH